VKSAPIQTIGHAKLSATSGTVAPQFRRMMSKHLRWAEKRLEGIQVHLKKEHARAHPISNAWYRDDISRLLSDYQRSVAFLESGGWNGNVHQGWIDRLSSIEMYTCAELQKIGLNKVRLPRGVVSVLKPLIGEVLKQVSMLRADFNGTAKQHSHQNKSKPNERRSV
jgi:hypothetical protein